MTGETPYFQLIRARRAGLRPGEGEFERHLVPILRRTYRGREALTLKRRYQVSVEFVLGEGGGYQAHRRIVRIGDRLSRERQALVFIHEMTHAWYEAEGKAADVHAASRQGYIRAKCEEEGWAIVRELESKLETELRSCLARPDGPRRLLERIRSGVQSQRQGNRVTTSDAFSALVFKLGWAEAVTAMRDRLPFMPSDSLMMAGRLGGHTRLVQAMGRFLGPAGESVTYEEYYGRLWDQRH